ncbi:IPT/TIG_domain-containing protein [Hexamita inflata]|uniref:IPT/TIG domain-containing protein n=1 Tax=Hexamita inflata TaxID=28002 RepID=A0AA86R6X4_9EUKA|nr:IPT/TIG domain-containing protein [Hexamita inflata]
MTIYKFNHFGLIGFNSGNTSIKNIFATFSVNGALFNRFGIIGFQQLNSIYAEVINLISSSSVSSTSGMSIGPVFGYDGSKNCSVQNTSVVGNISSGFSNHIGGIVGFQYLNTTIINSSVQNSSFQGLNNVGGIIGGQITNSNASIVNSSVNSLNISGTSYVSGIIGWQNQNDTNATIMNSQILNSNISGLSFAVGGIIGYQFSSSNTTIIDSLVKYLNISGSSAVGGIFGKCQSKLYLVNTQINLVRLSGFESDFGVVVGKDESGTYLFQNSTATSNYIKGIKQTECTSLSNIWSVSGC